ncbi:phosphorylated adapter RNA export protein [Harmonia axyridis]|uniref:phosphorylated adapter RNA export protein n=1 Tax=Harmonia axyridis TaxID=115357 RepID=UPI001E277705|nr:phosphorylated adapter RNA export protein [Harmonia axyridis]
MDNEEEIIMEELEDGEISSNSCDEYIPLERPPNYSNIPQPPVIEHSESEELDLSSDVDSDDSSVQNIKAKRPKIKLKPKPGNTSNKKKYDIWTTKVQEDVLSETLNSCDVTKKDRSRDVETYDYTLSFKMNRNSNKRTREDRKNIYCRLGKRSENDEKDNGKGASRIILDLHTTIENTDEEIAKDMANKLFELKENLIERSLKLIGKEKCFEVFKQTQEIEADGGLSVMNWTRRRTPGGVFFHLIKTDDSIDQKLRSAIFVEERKKDSKERKKKQTQKWKEQRDKERAKILPELLSKAELISKHRSLKEVSEDDVINPPPTPETDCQENSCDGIDNSASTAVPMKPLDNGKRSHREELIKYDDVLDIGDSNMDLF